MASERALLHTILRRLWGPSVGSARKWWRFFQGRAGNPRMQQEMRRFKGQELSDELLESFRQALQMPTASGFSLAEQVQESVDEFRWLRAGASVDSLVSARRFRLIGLLRQTLARSSIQHLQPDLVILDEFQRFNHLLTGTDDAAVLLQDLLGTPEIDDNDARRQARVLMLSATPFKMFTLPDEPEGDDHYRDFNNTMTFLAGPQRAAVIGDGLSRMRTHLVLGDHQAARDAKKSAERELRRVMARTERLAISADRDGMLTATSPKVDLSADDVRAYRDQSKVARALGVHDVLEYWRSTPYVFELMERYQIKSAIDRDVKQGAPQLAGLLRTPITPSDINRYDQVDLANPRTRWLADDVLTGGAWKIAWVPPSLPYYEPGGAYGDPRLGRFTKRLVFSAWAVAPKGIATMLSYDVERRLAQRVPTVARRGYFATRATGLLALTRAEGRNAGMPVLGLMYPSVALAEAGDPLAVAEGLGQRLPLPRTVLREAVREKVKRLLHELSPGHADGREDQRWYWAAPLLMDRQRGWHTLEELTFGGAHSRTGDEEHTGYADHIDEALHVEAENLGPRPADLADVLTDLAIAGPGVTALRTVARVATDGRETGAVRAVASDWAWSLRALFNTPELMAMVQGEGEQIFWRQVLDHCLDGNLQSVLDEYVQVLMAAHSLDGGQDSLETLAEKFAEGSGLRASTQAMDFYGEHAQEERRRLRTHFAVRYGRAATHDEATGRRESHVREAFNSPFWPFVLASTSVGQEGLDFHHYSHAVVHWNLPSNPVDLEQREGRVHRYRGHAVRKNIAAVHGGAGEVIGGKNPWPRLYELAAAVRGGRSEIFPDWVYPLDGGAAIERYVPILPLSRTQQHYRRLLRTLGAYRLTLGQPRQADLIAYVGEQADLALDLAP